MDISYYGLFNILLATGQVPASRMFRTIRPSTEWAPLLLRIGSAGRSTRSRRWPGDSRRSRECRRGQKWVPGFPKGEGCISAGMIAPVRAVSVSFPSPEYNKPLTGGPNLRGDVTVRPGDRFLCILYDFLVAPKDLRSAGRSRHGRRTRAPRAARP